MTPAEEWVGVTTYIRDRTDADFSHGICPDCADRLYPDFAGDAPGGAEG
jgi:hypothetical protein